MAANYLSKLDKYSYQFSGTKNSSIQEDNLNTFLKKQEEIEQEIEDEFDYEIEDEIDDECINDEMDYIENKSDDDLISDEDDDEDNDSHSNNRKHNRHKNKIKTIEKCVNKFRQNVDAILHESIKKAGVLIEYDNVRRENDIIREKNKRESILREVKNDNSKSKPNDETMPDSNRKSVEYLNNQTV